MSTINEVFEIHLHGQVQLRQDVTDKEINEALKPLWSQTGESTFKKGSASIYEDEPGIVLDRNESMLRICWTVVGEMKFHQNLDEFCMGLNELTAMGAAFEVTFYNEQFESGDQEDFVPDEEEEGEGNEAGRTRSSLRVVKEPPEKKRRKKKKSRSRSRDRGREEE